MGWPNRHIYELGVGNGSFAASPVRARPRGFSGIANGDTLLKSDKCTLVLEATKDALEFPTQPVRMQKVKALKLGDPLDAASDIGTIINEKQFRKVCGYASSSTAISSTSSSMRSGHNAVRGPRMMSLPTSVEPVKESGAGAGGSWYGRG
jgi:hypothetical protein